jgi:hypothetical protein
MRASNFNSYVLLTTIEFRSGSPGTLLFDLKACQEGYHVGHDCRHKQAPALGLAKPFHRSKRTARIGATRT